MKKEIHISLKAGRILIDPTYIACMKKTSKALSQRYGADYKFRISMVVSNHTTYALDHLHTLEELERVIELFNQTILECDDDSKMLTVIDYIRNEGVTEDKEVFAYLKEHADAISRKK